MESIQLNNDETSVKESSFEQLIRPSSHENSGISGNPPVSPRVGREYQAEIPPMISESEHSRLLLNPYDSEGIVDSSYSFLIGLPFPITWVHKKTDNGGDKECKMKNTGNSCNANGLSKSRTTMKNNILNKKGSKKNEEPLDLGLDDGQESKPANLESRVTMEANISQLHKNGNYDLVPGSFNHLWSEAEVNSFILGLYIFGKSFFQIKRFMGNKEMGDILAFYYGDFYASDGYHRWSDCQKKKRKKCIYGQKLFTGWRQQELLSRLHPHVPEHSQSDFLEVSTSFSEGKFSLEDYVSHLKAIVGIQALVDAIGISKGKEDLTSLAMEHGKNNPLFTVCPIGRACSSLTSSDIIKLLTGGFRLSKARCNDIFWEAVWPRLLARGWHSEQPKDQIYMGSNHCLVFLIPGVKKFSKRKLVKGNHYFDSVSDVLSKVASEPKLIELETEEAGGSSCNEEDKWVAEVASDQDDPSIQQSHRYLKPRVSNCNLNLVRFTIVDSGLVDGGKLPKMREMRYAPDDLKAKSLLTTLSSNIEMIFLEDSLHDNELQVAKNSTDGPKNANKVESCEKTFHDCLSNHTKFTIVDTSLIDVGKSSKVRELRYSGVGIKVTSERTNSLKKNEGDSSKASRDSLDGYMLVLNGEKNADKSNNSKDIIDSSSSEEKELNRDIRNKVVESLQDNINVPIRDLLARTIKHKFSRRPKPGNSNNLVPVVKRRRLTACAKAEISHVIENFSVGMESKKEGSCALNSREVGSIMLQVNTPEKLPSTTSLFEGGLQEIAGSMLGATFSRETCGENVNHHTPSLIDLNLPHVPLNYENDEPAIMHMESSRGKNVKLTSLASNLDKPEPEALSAYVDASTAAQQPGANPRRQSTRNRPLTTRALEALEYGLLGSVKRPKCMQVRKKELPFSSSSHWPENKLKLTSSRVRVGSGIVDLKQEDTTGTTSKKESLDRTEEKLLIS